MSLGYYEDWSKAVLGRRRRVRARDWTAPRRLMDRTDKELGACKAWILGGSAGDSADQPCIVFLTNRALYVDVWPYDGGIPGLIVAPFHMIANAKLGGTTLVALASTSSSTRRAIRTQPSCGALQSIFRETDMALPSASWSSVQSERVQARQPHGHISVPIARSRTRRIAVLRSAISRK